MVKWLWARQLQRSAVARDWMMKRNTGAARDEAKCVCACEFEAEKGTNISGRHADTASAASWKRLDVGLLPPYTPRTDAGFWSLKNLAKKIRIW